MSRKHGIQRTSCSDKLDSKFSPFIMTSSSHPGTDHTAGVGQGVRGRQIAVVRPVHFILQTAQDAEQVKAAIKYMIMVMV